MKTVVHLFLENWLIVRKANSAHRRSAPRVEVNIEKAIQDALSLSKGQEAAQALRGLIAAAPEGTPEADYKLLGLRLRIMECIDRAFAPIHPRSFEDSESDTFPNWLLEARADRRQHGIFGRCPDRDDHTGQEIGADLALIFRGPILRSQRYEYASSAENLADRFSYLSVVKMNHTLRYSPIAVEFTVVDQRAGQGVDDGTRALGAERICVIPVAEEFKHLELAPRIVDGRRYVAFSPASSFNPAATLLTALRRENDLDIALVPEFVMSPAAHDEVLTSLQADPVQCRLLLAGTANTTDRDVTGKPWNEAVVTNRYGVELWRQRKLWPSELTPERAHDYGITETDGDGPFHEDITSGSCIKVVDIDTLGRCVILICQDITAPDLTTALIAEVQPDWVFVPILDRGFAKKGWFKDLGQHLCTLSQARLVGICSTALPRKDATLKYCLQMFCTEVGENRFVPWRAVSLLAAEGVPGAAIHHFGVTGWKRYEEDLKDAM